MFALVLASALAVGAVGCDRPVDTRRPVGDADSREPTASVSAFYGESLVGTQVRRQDNGLAILKVDLSREVDDDRGPFVALATLIALEPDAAEYMAEYNGARVLYWWRPADGEVTKNRVSSSGDMATPEPVGVVSGLTTATIQAIASGGQPVPAFSKK